MDKNIKRLHCNPIWKSIFFTPCMQVKYYWQQKTVHREMIDTMLLIKKGRKKKVKGQSWLKAWNVSFLPGTQCIIGWITGYTLQGHIIPMFTCWCQQPYKPMVLIWYAPLDLKFLASGLRLGSSSIFKGKSFFYNFAPIPSNVILRPEKVHDLLCGTIWEES